MNTAGGVACAPPAAPGAVDRFGYRPPPSPCALPACHAGVTALPLPVELMPTPVALSLAARSQRHHRAEHGHRPPPRPCLLPCRPYVPHRNRLLVPSWIKMARASCPAALHDWPVRAARIAHGGNIMKPLRCATIVLPGVVSRPARERSDMDARFLTYLIVAAILIVTPGPDMALVARNAFRGGYPAARATAFGVGAGIFVWGAGTAAGLASALAASAALFSALKLAGAAFLVALGVRSLAGALRPDRRAATRPRSVAARRGPAPSGAFVQGLL